MDWTIETATKALSERGYVFNLGQLPADVKRHLDRLAKAGTLVKAKACWPYWTHGTCTKTGWRLA